MATNTATQNIEFEDIPREQTEQKSEAIEAKVLTADDIAKNEIQKFNLADAAIDAMKKKYSGLTISGIEDREGYKKVKAAWQIVRGKRLQVEKTHKIIKADYLVVSRAIDGEKNRLVELLEPLESELKTELDRIDNAIEEKKQEAERIAQARLQTRVATLLENGIQFNGSFYAIGETITVDVVVLKNLSDDEFNQLLQRVQAENSKIIAAKAEAERLEREERERIEAQRIENERQEQELKRQREEMERQQADMRRQRTQLRIDVLKNAGLTYHIDHDGILIKNFPDAGLISIKVREFEYLDGDAWDAKFLEIRADINRLRALQAEKDEERKAEQLRKVEEERQRKEKADRWNARASELYKLGMHELNGRFYILTDTMDEMVHRYAVDMFDAPEDEWTKILEGIKTEISDTRIKDDENKRRAAEEKEAERLAAMSDIERVDLYLSQLAEIRDPQIKDARVLAAFKLFDQTVANAVDTLHKTLELIQK